MFIASHVTRTIWIYFPRSDIFVNIRKQKCTRHLKDIMNVSKMSFVRYGCLKDVLYILNVPKMSFVRYGCLKDVLYILNV